jgi:hypothetical protein
LIWSSRNISADLLLTTVTEAFVFLESDFVFPFQFFRNDLWGLGFIVYRKPGAESYLKDLILQAKMHQPELRLFMISSSVPVGIRFPYCVNFPF